MPGGGAGSSAPRRLSSLPRYGPRGLLLGALVSLLVLLALRREARTACRAAALLPYLFPGAPVRPLDWITAAPIQEEVRYSNGTRDLLADLYRPGAPGRHAAILVSPGVRPVPRDDPALVRLATGLARDGFVVLIPESPDLRADRVLPSERDSLVAAFRFLQDLPYVDAKRIGFVGFSVGSSLLAVTAADPRISAEVRMVNFFGGYDDAAALLRAIASREMVLEDGTVIPWKPADHVRTLFAGVLLEFVDDPADRALVSRALKEGPDLAPEERLGLGERARYLYDLFTAPDAKRVDALLAELPDDLRERLRVLSPSTYAADLRTRLYVMHDVEDSFVPYVESRRLVARLPQAQRVHTEFSLFAHMHPRAVNVPVFAREVSKLLRHLYLAMLELA